jgi:hypothetical protein
MKVAWSAVNWIWMLTFCLWVQSAWAAGEAAVVLSASGTVLAKKTDGKIHALAKDSTVNSGDVVITEKSSAARLRFTDGSTVILRPNSRLVIENYQFEEKNPKADSAVLNLVKGGLRTVTGLVGKRGNQDAHQTKSSAANIGIRGTDYALLLCEVGDAMCAAEFKQEMLDAISNRIQGEVPPGLYLAVIEGVIIVSNNAGEKRFPAVVAGYVADFNTLPIELTGDPGLIRLFPVLGNLPGVDDLRGDGAGQASCLVR